MAQELLDLDIEKVDPPAVPSRELINPEKIRELAESIREIGLKEPILVRPVNGRYEIVAGHRRWLAHRLIGSVRIRALSEELDDKQVAVIRAVENDQREDLNPIEKAKNYKRLRDEFQMTLSEIAHKMSRHTATIHKYLQLLDVPEEFQRYVADGTVSLQVALILKEVDDPQMSKYFFDMAVQNGITMTVARLWVDDYFKSKQGSFYSDGAGEVGAFLDVPEVPQYVTCRACNGAVNVKEARNVIVCPTCMQSMMSKGRPRVS